MTDTKETTVDSLDEELLSQFEQHFLAIESDEDREQVLRGLRAVYAEGVRQASEIARSYGAAAQDDSNAQKSAGDYRQSDMSFGRSVGADAVADRLDALLTEREGV